MGPNSCEFSYSIFTLRIHHVHASAAALGATSFIDDVTHLPRIFDAAHRQNRGRGIGRVEHDRTEIEHPIDETLPNSDVVDIDKQDAILGLAQNSAFDDQTMCGQSILHREPLISQREDEIAKYNKRAGSDRDPSCGP